MRVTTGLKKLDSLLSGGLPENAVTLLSGGPGSGKTLVALKYIMEGAAKGEKCCFVTLNETKEEVIKACESVKCLADVNKYLGKNLAIEHVPMGQSNVTMKRFVEILSNYPSLDRVAIDNVNKLLLFSDDKKSYRAYLIEMIRSLKAMRSSLLICETDNGGLDSGGHESFECDGVIQLLFLDLEEKPMRALIVHKMRCTQFDPKVPHELVISSSDIKLTETKVI